MQPPDLAPNRTHGLDDIIERMNTDRPWTPSWADICRVRAYVGGVWPPTRSGACGNAYDIAGLVLYHLEDVQKAHTAIAPYVAVACEQHNTPIGVPCALLNPQDGSPLCELPLPGVPSVCTWRVLSKHNRLEALEVLESRLPSPRTHGARDILMISAELPFQSRENTDTAFATARVQYRHPQPLVPKRLVVSGDWVIHDIRVGGKSALAPHLDLPSALFRNDVMGPSPRLPPIEQDQWIEIDASPARDGDNPWFRAGIIGTISQEHGDMNESANTDTLKKFQELQEQHAVNHLAACERVRKKLELPIEALALIDKVLRAPDDASAYFRGHHAVGTFPSQALRSPLRLLSETKIKRTDPINGKPTTVHVRPSTAMRVEEIEILSEPDCWMIADIQVGTRSQFPQPGPPLPGRLFTPGGTCHRFVTEALQTAMDFRLLVHYVGPATDGSIFEAVAMGSSV